MSKDIIKLPTSRVQGLNKKAEQPLPDPNQVAIQKITSNRKNGLERLEAKIDCFDNQESFDDPLLEEKIRDIQAALRATYLNLEALNSMVDMIAHDLMGSIQNLQETQVNQFQSSAHLQVLLEVLKKEGTVTEENLRATWEEIITKPMKKTTEEVPK